eukprot:CAMPEP_0170827964 /NCGR_PEP_ID=MMETSP0733-20121128/47579_1 /TAXON_ID=186038 /ORGANISM="Fragilariopsis kerguelensis, Strain L26-C5" /LENGTH=64 /DNA_ID=CAMNT_0011192237 /DNA_START=172 /DNA_END=363 /DNA_ORIENTATION=+
MDTMYVSSSVEAVGSLAIAISDSDSDRDQGSVATLSPLASSVSAATSPLANGSARNDGLDESGW